jgi:hypothetical protein
MSYEPRDYDENYGQQGYAPDGYGNGEGAAGGKATTPGIMLAIVGVLNLLAALGMAGMGVFALAQPEAQIRESQKKTQELFPGLPVAEQDPSQVKTTQMVEFFGGGGLAAVAGLVILLGGIQMCRLRGYGLAMVGAILALLPCISPSGCCILGQVAGIWAIAVLINPDVKSAFR